MIWLDDMIKFIIYHTDTSLLKPLQINVLLSDCIHSLIQYEEEYHLYIQSNPHLN